MYQLQQIGDGEAVALKAETGDEAAGVAGRNGMVSEILAGVDVGDVHLHHGDGHGGYCIRYGYGVMCISRGVYYNASAFGSKTIFLDGVDYCAFGVRLKILYLHVGEVGAQRFEKTFETFSAVNFRLAFAEQIEVGAVYNQNHSRY